MRQMRATRKSGLVMFPTENDSLEIRNRFVFHSELNMPAIGVDINVDF